MRTLPTLRSGSGRTRTHRAERGVRAPLRWGLRQPSPHPSASCPQHGAIIEPCAPCPCRPSSSLAHGRFRGLPPDENPSRHEWRRGFRSSSVMPTVSTMRRVVRCPCVKVLPLRMAPEVRCPLL
jgi:hypothetical protein